MNHKSSLPTNKGFGIIEALIGITIGGLLLGAFSTLIVRTMKVNRINALNIKAMMYLQEMIEVAKDMEQSATTTVFGPPNDCNTSSACHPKANNSFSPPRWELALGKEKLENEVFTQSMIIGDTGDDNVKIATATISWYDGSQNHTANMETYLYYYGQ
jgi:type II secretory pathway pseudopilin PulG